MNSAQIPSTSTTFPTRQMQALQQTSNQPVNPENRKPHLFRITSETLGRVIYASDLASMGINELRSLYHEVYCDRQSMFHAMEGFNQQLNLEHQEVDEARDHIDSTVKKLSKKITVYNSFYKLIKREVNWRTSLNQLARVQIIIQAKQVGLNDAQINALLDPEMAVHKIYAISEYSASPGRRKAISVEDRVKSMRHEMLMAELCNILSREFDASELAEIQEEAKTKVDNLVDWCQIHEILHEHLPDEKSCLHVELSQ